MGIKHDASHPRGALWGADHIVDGAAEGDTLLYEGGEWVAAPPTGGEVLMVTGIDNPPEPLLNSAGDDWMYSS